jgi:hypothetical protein
MGCGMSFRASNAILSMSIILAMCSASSGALIQESDFTFIGAFRVPQGAYNGISYEYGGRGLAYNSANNSLFILSIYNSHVAEFSIPAPVNSSTLGDLNIAINLQSFEDITEGNRNNIGEGGVECTGTQNFMGDFLIYNGSMYGSVYNYYDAALCAELSHFKSGTTLSTTGDFDGMYRVGDSAFNVGFRAGYMCEIPDAWQSSFGGATAFTGLSFVAVMGRTSFGPSISTFYPDSLGVSEPSPSTMLVYYEDQGDDATFGTYYHPHDANPYISTADWVGGVEFPEGSDTVLFIGMHGTGDWCYKCPEPNNPAGTGAWPYQYFVWAYDANDLAASHSGNYTVTQDDYNANRFWDGVYPNNTSLAVGDTVRPYNVVPYDTWALTFPIEPDTTVTNWKEIRGTAYDPATNRLYLSAADIDGRRPVIQVYEINLSSPEDISITGASVSGGSLALSWTDSGGSSEWQVQATINATTSYTILVDSASASFPVAAGTIDIKITGNASGYTQGQASN